MNQGLKPLQDAVNGDWASLPGDLSLVDDLFSTAVIPGQRLPLEKLQHGMELVSLHGHTVTITVMK